MPDLDLPPDLRLPLLGLGAWAGGLAGHLLPAPVTGAALLVGAAVLVLRRRRGILTGAGLLVVVAAVAAVSLLRQEQVERNPVAALARDRAVAVVELAIASDPRVVAGRYADQVLVRGTVREVTGRGQTRRLATPVLVIAGEEWLRVPLGSRVRVTGRLGPARGHGLAAVLSTRDPPEVVTGPDLWWRGAAAVRASIRDSVSGRPDHQRALVPALVDGDDAALDPALADDFRETGLTHLLAVSGTNLTLVVGFLLVLARWVGVRGRALRAVAALGIVGFVLLARTEPSVVRAAAMGSVALLAMGTDGRRRGARALGAAVVALLLVDPGLAVSVGFALSVLATAGILLLAPGWRDALDRWLPRWLAEAIAIPAAAQLACTPIVAAISGQVSMVAVVTNLAVAPVIGPATVLGLGGGLVGLLVPPAGTVLGTLAGWCVAWLVLVATRGAALPTASVAWQPGVLSIGSLTALVLAIALLGPRLLARPAGGIGCTVLLVVAVLVRPPTPGWPPEGWVVVACDVGQGDAIVLRAGPGSGVVVDAGPDPPAVDRCLDRLGISQVPLVVLTHFHADHVDGLTGVLDGREVGTVEVSPVADPSTGAADVSGHLAGAGLRPLVAPYGATRSVGDVRLQVLGPVAGASTDPGSQGSEANNASVVLLAEVRGVRILLSGDIEPEAQLSLARAWPDLRVDVLKVPHHGSRYQDFTFLTGLGARLALVSAGADNDYGHPAPETVAALTGAGARVLSTDVAGDLAVVVRDGELTATSTG